MECREWHLRGLQLCWRRYAPTAAAAVRMVSQVLQAAMCSSVLLLMRVCFVLASAFCRVWRLHTTCQQSASQPDTYGSGPHRPGNHGPETALTLVSDPLAGVVYIICSPCCSSSSCCAAVVLLWPFTGFGWHGGYSRRCSGPADPQQH